MLDSIMVTPAVRRLRLREVGCWRELDIAFSPSLNIFAEENSTMGKTTLLQSICQVLIPSLTMDGPLKGIAQRAGGSISMELRSTSISTDLDALHSINHHRFFEEPTSQWMGRILRQYIAATTNEQALLLDDSVCAQLAHHLQEAVTLLQEADCQVICMMAHTYPLVKVSGARVFGLSMEDQDRVARCRILEEGRH